MSGLAAGPSRWCRWPCSEPPSRPEGPSLLLYPLRYVEAGDWGMANISEWQSPDFHDPAHWPLLIFMAATAIFARWRVPWWMSILAFLGIAMTLVALRNGAVAAILGAPALAVGIDAALHDWRPTQRTPSPRVARQRRILELVMAAIVAVAGVLIFVPRDPAAAVDESIERELPVQGVELLLEKVPDGRILSWYGWGGYVIGQMYDHGARVFVDGRNDMYDEAILEDYNLVRGAEPGWAEVWIGTRSTRWCSRRSRRSARAPQRMPAGARPSATTTRSSSCGRATDALLVEDGGIHRRDVASRIGRYRASVVRPEIRVEQDAEEVDGRGVVRIDVGLLGRQRREQGARPLQDERGVDFRGLRIGPVHAGRRAMVREQEDDGWLGRLR